MAGLPRLGCDRLEERSIPGNGATVQQFTTALKAAEDPSGSVTFQIDGREVVAHEPDTAQMAVLIAGFGRHRSEADKIATFIDFFEAVLDEDSVHYVIDRLLDRKDAFGVEELAQVGEWLIEEWGGHPTQPPSGSSQSRPTGGRASKRPTTKSTTSSRSRSVASST